MHFKTEQDRETWARQMGVGADGAELRSEDASRRAEGAQDGRKHGALERRSGSVFLKERARRSDKAGT